MEMAESVCGSRAAPFFTGGGNAQARNRRGDKLRIDQNPLAWRFGSISEILILSYT